MSLFSEFMEHLAERRYKENDLSDITYALLLSDEKFKTCFFQFLTIPIDQILEIKRECKFDDSRPDFIIKMQDGSSYLVEIKINDRHTHIAQYCQNKELENYNKIYLSNYELIGEDLPENDNEFLNNFTRKTWRELYEVLDKANKKKQSDAITGYLAYIKSVCCIFDIKDISLNQTLVQLGQFKMYLRELIQTASIDDLEIQPYNTAYNYSDTSSGTYFSVSSKTAKYIIYPWIGVCYQKDISICMYFEFAKGWCSILEKDANKISSALEKKDSIECTKTNSELIAKLDQDSFNEFQKKDNIINQKQKLTDFFEQTLDVIKEYFKEIESVKTIE